MFAWRRWLKRLLGHSVQVNQRESVQQLDCNWHGLSKQALMWVQKPLDVRIRESRLRKSKVDSRFALRLETYEPFKNTNQEYKTLKWALYFWCFSSVWSERKQIHGQQWNGSYEIYSMLFCAMGTCFAESIGWYWLQALGRYEHELRCAINLSGTGVRLLGISSIERDADLDRECSNCIVW